ncbi:MAG TPA: PDZ domain-containing protein [Thermoanaerobaculia bacterium]|nr:PDZ domain-containing protein [Thermoanaerobaculia bacterium]
MPEPISYTLRFPAPQTHYVEVEAVYPTGGRPEIELMMAVWTPGSYLVREFSRNIEEVRAASESGAPLPIQKTAKNRWRIETRKAPRVKVQYRVYGREMSVRTNFIEAGFAILNGAPTFLTLADAAGAGKAAPEIPHEVRVELPPQWKVFLSPLQTAPGTGEAVFRAPSFDLLVDSPFYAGNAAVHRFEVAGKPHFLVNEGEGTVWDGPRSAADAQRIVQQQVDFWGFAPYPRYVFFNLITESSGGLEHRDSTVLMTSRWKARTHEGYLDWLSLVSHEFFHVWNVKRMRPVELGPFEYEREVYTPSLWVAEGLTAYYDDLLVRRAGLGNRPEYLKRLSKQIEELQTNPGRLVQPLGQASFDAWIKYYRRDENFDNTGTSYYTKGAVVGFLLDARIRRATQGRKSLDDALRLAYQRYSGERGFTQEQFRATVEEIAGVDLDPFFHRAVDTTEELDYTEALGWYGLQFIESDDEDEPQEKPEPGLPKEESGWLGVETEVRNGRLVVLEVTRGTPGYDAGINVEDEILAIDDYRVPPEGWKDRLKAYRPGESARLLVARRERLTTIPVVFGPKPHPCCKLVVDPKATPEQQAHLAAWLGPETAPSADYTNPNVSTAQSPPSMARAPM